MNERWLKKAVFVLIRASLALSIALNIASLALDLAAGRDGLASGLTRRMESVFWAALTLALSYLSSYVERRERIDIPDVLEIVIAVFIYAAIFLSAQFNLYYKYFWWDDLLHTMSGVIIGFIGFLIVYLLNHNYSMNLNPLLIALFSFAFAVSMGVIWEIFEFAVDVAVGSANQKWDLPPTEPMLGKPYQGSGLRDTMTDLIVDSLGALVTSTIVYFGYKYRKDKTIRDMERMIDRD